MTVFLTALLVLVGCDVVISLHSTFFVLRGVIWLAIATAAELPQVVGPASSIIVHSGFLYLFPFFTVVTPVFECER
jgi:hypothetical protein